MLQLNSTRYGHEYTGGAAQAQYDAQKQKVDELDAYLAKILSWEKANNMTWNAESKESAIKSRDQARLELQSLNKPSKNIADITKQVHELRVKGSGLNELQDADPLPANQATNIKDPYETFSEYLRNYYTKNEPGKLSSTNLQYALKGNGAALFNLIDNEYVELERNVGKLNNKPKEEKEAEFQKQKFKWSALANLAHLMIEKKEKQGKNFASTISNPTLKTRELEKTQYAKMLNTNMFEIRYNNAAVAINRFLHTGASDPMLKLNETATDFVAIEKPVVDKTTINTVDNNKFIPKSFEKGKDGITLVTDILKDYAESEDWKQIPDQRKVTLNYINYSTGTKREHMILELANKPSSLKDYLTLAKENLRISKHTQIDQLGNDPANKANLGTFYEMEALRHAASGLQSIMETKGKTVPNYHKNKYVGTIYTEVQSLPIYGAIGPNMTLQGQGYTNNFALYNASNQYSNQGGAYLTGNQYDEYGNSLITTIQPSAHDKLKNDQVNELRQIISEITGIPTSEIGKETHPYVYGNKFNNTVNTFKPIDYANLLPVETPEPKKIDYVDHLLIHRQHHYDAETIDALREIENTDDPTRKLTLVNSFIAKQSQKIISSSLGKDYNSVDSMLLKVMLQLNEETNRTSFTNDNKDLPSDPLFKAIRHSLGFTLPFGGKAPSAQYHSPEQLGIKNLPLDAINVVFHHSAAKEKVVNNNKLYNYDDFISFYQTNTPGVISSDSSIAGKLQKIKELKNADSTDHEEIFKLLADVLEKESKAISFGISNISFTGTMERNDTATEHYMKRIEILDKLVYEGMRTIPDQKTQNSLNQETLPAFYTARQLWSSTKDYLKDVYIPDGHAGIKGGLSLAKDIVNATSTVKIYDNGYIDRAIIEATGKSQPSHLERIKASVNLAKSPEATTQNLSGYYKSKALKDAVTRLEYINRQVEIGNNSNSGEIAELKNIISSLTGISIALLNQKGIVKKEQTTTAKAKTSSQSYTTLPGNAYGQPNPSPYSTIGNAYGQWVSQTVNKLGPSLARTLGLNTHKLGYAQTW